MKSKWVRVELRKVEVLPTGGAANTFYDFIGPSPFDVWRATNEYDILTTVSGPVDRLRGITVLNTP